MEEWEVEDAEEGQVEDGKGEILSATWQEPETELAPVYSPETACCTHCTVEMEQ